MAIDDECAISARSPSSLLAALLFKRFGDVLIPVNDVRLAYFPRRSPNRFKRALRSGEIALPITRVDDSSRGDDLVSVHALAEFIIQREQHFSGPDAEPLKLSADETTAVNRAVAHHNDEQEANHG